MNKGKGSDGAFCVKTRFNKNIDSHLSLDDDGEVANPREMQTHRFVCTYRHRPTDSSEFVDDVLKNLYLLLYRCID